MTDSNSTLQNTAGSGEQAGAVGQQESFDPAYDDSGLFDDGDDSQADVVDQQDGDDDGDPAGV